MGVIEDVRKVIQDTVAPDLKALAVKVEELEKRMDLKFQVVDQRFADQRDYLEKRFDSVDKQFDDIDKRFDGVEKRFDGIDKRFDGIDNSFDGIDKRFDALERMLNQQQVINNLVERIRFLESSTRAVPAAHEESKIERAG